MLRNNNQEISARISQRNIRDNRLRFGILIGVTAVIVMAMTALYIGSMYMIDMLNIQGKQAEGRYHIGSENLTEEEVRRVAGSDTVEAAGVAAILGDVANAPLLYWDMTVASADEAFMRSCNSYPETGRVPEKENEIAVDTNVLDALGISRKTGEKITVQWENEGVLYENEFVITGFWDGNKYIRKGHMWVSSDFAESLGESVFQVHASLKNPYFLKEKAEKLEQNAGLREGSLYVNKRFQMGTVWNMLSSALPLWFGIVFLFLCGKFILETVFYLYVVKDMPHYECMRLQGMTERQRKGILYYQVKYVWLLGSIPGMAAGILLGNLMIGRLLADKGIIPLKMHFSVLSVIGVLGLFMILWAVRKSVKFIAKPEFGKGGFKRKKRIFKRRRNVIWNLVWAEICSGKRLFPVIMTLALGMGLFCAVSTMQKSYRAEKYVESETISDIILEDKSLSDKVNSPGYNPYNQTVSKKLLNELEALGTISDMGSLYWAETQISLSDKVYENLISYFEADDGARIEYMSYDEVWVDAYYKMKETQETMAVVLGTDGLVNQRLEQEGMLQGEFDREKFENGNYVIADTMAYEGVEDGTYPNYETGDIVEIEGETFEVMAVTTLGENLFVLAEGATSSEAAFSPFFLMSSKAFQRLYPGHTVKKQFLNAEGENLEKTIQFLETYQKEQNQNLHMITKQMLEEQFWKDAKVKTNTLALICAATIIAGMLSFVNTVTVGIWKRKETFRRLYSAGMTKKELKKMVVAESMMIAGMAAAGAVVIGILAAGIGMRIYLETVWTSAYTCSLTPLLIFIPLLIVAAVVVSLAAFKRTDI